jgi:hypothetical protein
MKARLIANTLQALDAGRLSAEEALRAALRGTTVLRERLSRAERRATARPTIRAVKTYPALVAERAVARVRRHLRLGRSIRSIHWGVRQVRGRRTGEPCVVIHVVGKRTRRTLRGSRATAPRTVTVSHAGRRFVVPVDVQRVGSSATLHLDVASPGDHVDVRADGMPVGSLGGVVTGSNGDQFAVTAGHVADVIGPRVAQCRDIEGRLFNIGTVRCNALSHGTDVAALGPIQGFPTGAVQPPVFARDADDIDVNHRIVLLLPESITPVETHIDGVRVNATFGTASGALSLDGLTSADRVTRGGDSGAAALDMQGNLIGFVVGGDGTHTYLLPARRALNALQDCL